MVIEKTENFVFPFQSLDHWKAIYVAEDHVTLHDISLEIVRYEMAVRKWRKCPLNYQDLSFSMSCIKCKQRVNFISLPIRSYKNSYQGVMHAREQ